MRRAAAAGVPLALAGFGALVGAQVRTGAVFFPRRLLPLAGLLVAGLLLVGLGVAGPRRRAMAWVAPAILVPAMWWFAGEWSYDGGPWLYTHEVDLVLIGVATALALRAHRSADRAPRRAMVLAWGALSLAWAGQLWVHEIVHAGCRGGCIQPSIGADVVAGLQRALAWPLGVSALVLGRAAWLARRWPSMSLGLVATSVWLAGGAILARFRGEATALDPASAGTLARVTDAVELGFALAFAGLLAAAFVFGTRRGSPTRQARWAWPRLAPVLLLVVATSAAPRWLPAANAARWVQGAQAWPELSLQPLSWPEDPEVVSCDGVLGANAQLDASGRLHVFDEGAVRPAGPAEPLRPFHLVVDAGATLGQLRDVATRAEAGELTMQLALPSRLRPEAEALRRWPEVAWHRHARSLTVRVGWPAQEREAIWLLPASAERRACVSETGACEPHAGWEPLELWVTELPDATPLATLLPRVLRHIDRESHPIALRLLPERRPSRAARIGSLFFTPNRPSDGPARARLLVEALARRLRPHAAACSIVCVLLLGWLVELRRWRRRVRGLVRRDGARGRTVWHRPGAPYRTLASSVEDARDVTALTRAILSHWALGARIALAAVTRALALLLLGALLGAGLVALQSA
ncbi:MAG: hypothetical protein AAGH15_00675 [Myxococcota bacterium]